jgi:hypothetical protein
LRLQRNYSEAVQLLQGHPTQFSFGPEYDKGWEQLTLALMQRLAGDTAGAKVTAEQARNTFEQLCRDQPENQIFAAWLSQAYAVMGEKDLALNLRSFRRCLARTGVRSQLWPSSYKHPILPVIPA